MLTRRLKTLSLVIGLVFACSGLARAQTHKLSYMQAGVALEYAEKETRILYAAVTAKQFDLGFTKAIVGQLEASLNESKSNVSRAESLLPEKLGRMSAQLEKVRERLVAAETQLEKLAAAIEEETKVLTIEDEEEAAELPPTDWKLLETQTRWLSEDIRMAVRDHKKILNGLGVRMPPAVKKPRGKRD